LNCSSCDDGLSTDTQSCTPIKKVKFFLSHMGHKAVLISVSIALSQTPATLQRTRG